MSIAPAIGVMGAASQMRSAAAVTTITPISKRPGCVGRPTLMPCFVIQLRVNDGTILPPMSEIITMMTAMPAKTLISPISASPAAAA